jgi:hypothetical protein
LLSCFHMLLHQQGLPRVLLPTEYLYWYHEDGETNCIRLPPWKRIHLCLLGMVIQGLNAFEV